MSKKYKNGIYGGVFNPLHLGHVDCIIRGAALCDNLYVILSVSNNENEIDFRIRYRWLYETVSHIGNVRLLILESQLKEKSDYTDEMAIKDSEYIRACIGSPVDMVICGSDYKDGGFYKVCYPEADIVTIIRNDISSTEIRKNPYSHWDELPYNVKPYYTKKVLLCGIESTGKSTLTVNLANYYATNYVDEKGRDLSMRSGTDEYMLPIDYTEILLRHKLAEIDAVQHSNKLLFVDTDCMYTRFYLDFLEDESNSANVHLADAINELNDYDLILFLEPDVPFVQDGGRSEIIAGQRKEYTEKLKSFITEYNKHFVSLYGDYNQKYLQTIQLCNSLIHYEDNL